MKIQEIGDMFMAQANSIKETMTHDEKKQAIREFLETATPHQLSDFVHLMEGKHGLNPFSQAAKALAFIEMLKVLDMNIHVWKSPNSKRYKTILHINREIDDYVLFISKKDSQDTNATYQRLYDEYKDELLDIIETKNRATLDKEAV